MAEILDITVIVLLVVAIAYGFRLNSKINLIKDSRKELAKLFKSFDNTILKAQESIEELKKASDEASHGLQQKIDKASLLIDDLSFINEKATKVSTQVMQVIEDVKKAPLVNIQSENKVSSGAADTGSPAVSLSPQEVVKLRQQNKARKAAAIKRSPNKKQIQAQPQQQNKDKTKALEEILTQIAKKKDKSVSNDNQTTSPKAAPTQKESVAQALKALGYGQDTNK